MHSYCIDFAFHSGKIENDKITYHDTREILDKDEEMGKLLDELEDLNENQALVATAYFHAEFENIHPLLTV